MFDEDDPFQIPKEEGKVLTEREQIDLLKSYVYPRLVLWLVATALTSLSLFCGFGAVLLAFKMFGG